MRKIIIGLSPLFLALPSISVAAPLQWQVSEASGEVRLTQNGQSRAAVRGALLASGATITTGAKARAVIVRGEEFVVISPGSQLRVPAASTPNAIMQMIEDFGTAVFKIKKKSTPHFGVQTPYLAAVVKGTTFTVSVGPEGGSVQVTEGAVQVSTLDGGAADLVEPGDIASVGASDLYQLTIEGDASKIIRSQNGPAASGAVTSSNALPAGGGSPTPLAAGSATFAGPAAQPFTIGAAIGEDPQSLGAVTDGLVDGDVAMELAAVAVHDMRAPAVIAERGNSDAQGGSNAAPGEAGQAPGQSGDAHGHGDDADGKSDNSGKPGSVSDNSGSGGSGSGSSADKEAEKAAKEAEKAAEDAAKAAEKAAEEAAKDAEKAAKDAAKAAEDAAKDAEKAAEEAAKAAEKAAEEAAKEAEKAAEEAAKDAEKAAEEAAKAAEKAAEDAAKADDGLCVLGAVCVDIL